ncbi:hypothetical protein ACFQ4C_29835 [Larkinella insperata]|uniref:Uncharacterized protein n=1 Tax=Larkinella insperata TaxID=332158 RepID=A0ABW3QMQ5_9BACT
MNESTGKSLAEISRQKNAAKSANSLIPAAPKLTPKPVSSPEPVEGEGEKLSTVMQQQPAAPLPTQTARNERKRGSTIVLEDVVGQQPSENNGYNKMIGITEEHHELLRELNFKYRKPMTAILSNVLDLLKQSYQKEKEKDK